MTPRHAPSRLKSSINKSLQRVIVQVDGGSRGNPGPSAAGVVVSHPDGTVLHEAGIYLGRTTNNVAEYRGLVAGLEAAAALRAAEAEVVSDSELLIRQMTGEYRVRNADLRPLYEQARQLADKFSVCTFRHVRREDNRRADKLVNRALNLRRNVSETL